MFAGRKYRVYAKVHGARIEPVDNHNKRLPELLLNLAHEYLEIIIWWLDLW
jgi:hypothetical protein